MSSLAQRIQQIPWATLSHAYGSAQDTPQHLLNLLSDDEETRNAAFGQLWASICHQGSVYEASCAAIPFLLDILQQAPTSTRIGILALLEGLAHRTWYAQRSLSRLTLEYDNNMERHHQWWSFESFLQQGGNVYHEPEWLVQAHKLVGEGLPIYRTLLHASDQDVVAATLDLLAGYREFCAELIPELLTLHAQRHSPALQSALLHCLSALLPEEAPEWALYAHAITDHHAAPLVRFAAAESLAWYHSQSPSPEAVAVLTEVMLACSLQPARKGFADTTWHDLSTHHFTRALNALCRLEPVVATQALSHVLRHAAADWIILDALRVAEALLDVAFFGGWLQDRYWSYRVSALLPTGEFPSTEFDQAFFAWEFGTEYSRDWDPSSEPEIVVSGYDEQEAQRLQQAYREHHRQALNGSQRLALETVVQCDALWRTSHELLTIYGLPKERTRVASFLTEETLPHS